jgi:signal transduction histidine kinase
MTAVMDPDSLLRTVSHGLANRLLSIRCYAELAIRASDRGDDPRDDLVGLLEETKMLTTLLRDLAPAASAATLGGRLELAELSRLVADRFINESAVDLKGVVS